MEESIIHESNFRESMKMLVVSDMEVKLDLSEKEEKEPLL